MHLGRRHVKLGAEELALGLDEAELARVVETPRPKLVVARESASIVIRRGQCPEGDREADDKGVTEPHLPDLARLKDAIFSSSSGCPSLLSRFPLRSDRSEQ